MPCALVQHYNMTNNILQRTAHTFCNPHTKTMTMFHNTQCAHTPTISSSPTQQSDTFHLTHLIAHDWCHLPCSVSSSPRTIDTAYTNRHAIIHDSLVHSSMWHSLHIKATPEIGLVWLFVLCISKRDDKKHVFGFVFCGFSNWWSVGLCGCICNAYWLNVGGEHYLGWISLANEGGVKHIR